jgi:hypothetical protein
MIKFLWKATEQQLVDQPTPLSLLQDCCASDFSIGHSK